MRGTGNIWCSSPVAAVEAHYRTIRECRERRMKAATKGVQEGQQAPEFTLPSQFGEPVSLADYRGKQVVVLYFYPKDNTAGCTAEACAFRDSHEVSIRSG